MDPPQVPNRSVIGSFYSDLLKLDIDNLNNIDIKEHPKWARRVIDAERKRRKNNVDTTPSKAEKSKILSLGEGNKKIKKKKPPTRIQVDGEPLHEHVANILDYQVSYNRHFSPSKERSLAVFGTLQCPSPDCRNHWVSGICATVIEFSRSSMAYRTTIHSQKCRECFEYAEPALDPESYSTKVKSVLDLWTGRRDAIKPLKRDGPDGPHEEDLCHACSIGKCPWTKKED